MARISLAVVKALKPGATVWDTDLRGFGVRRRQDKVTYVCKTRVHGRQRWFTIGEHGSPWTPDTARKECQDALYHARKGVAHDAERVKAKQRAEHFSPVFDEFIESHGPHLKPRTLEEYKRIGRQYLKPRFGTKVVEQMTASDALKAHAAWSDKTRAANHAIMVLSKFFSWCEDNNRREGKANPCRKVKKFKEERRERYLRPEEVKRLGQVLEEALSTGEFDVYTIGAIKLLLFTGARLSEILTLKWSYIDHQKGIALLPDSKTGGKALTLNPPALSILAHLPRFQNNPYVICGKNPGCHLINLQKPWRCLRARADLDDVRLHDLRHSFASFAADSGGSLEVVGQVLGHTRPDTTAGYVHLFDHRPRELSTATATRIEQLLRSGLAKPMERSSLFRIRSRQGTAGKPRPGR